MSGQNIICKQVVSIDFQSNEAEPFAVQEQATKWCNEMLAPAIARALEPLCAQTDIIRMDSLVIDVSSDPDPFTPLLAEQIAKALLQQIEAARASAQPTTIINSEQSFEEAFLFFLSHGYLPWWCSSTSSEVFGQKVRLLAEHISEPGRRQMRHLLSGKLIARRMVMALNDEVLVLLMSAITGKAAAALKESLTQIETLAQLIENGDLNRNFLQETTTDFVCALVSAIPLPQGAALRLLLEGKPVGLQENKAIESVLHNWVLAYQMPVDGLLQVLKNIYSILPGRNMRKNIMNQNLLELQQPLQAAQANTEVPPMHTSGFYINNAGLILVAPFLPRFFANLGIVADGRFNSKDLAVALMQYLVSGAEEYAEYDTVFAKLLCGMEPEAPIVLIPRLPEGFKEESRLLLEAIIGHWPALKNTSVAGLQEAFLQREGKLSLQENTWVLQVSQKAYDLLLNDLPWTIHTVKLPWMGRAIRTEWV